MPIKEFDDVIIGDFGEVTWKGKTLIGLSASIDGEQVSFQVSELSFRFLIEETEKVAALIGSLSARTDFYAYSRIEQEEIVRKLTSRLMGVSTVEKDPLVYRIAVPHKQQIVTIGFTPWRSPANTMVNITYVVLIVEDETKPKEVEGKHPKTGEPIMILNQDRWTYYYVTACAVDTLVAIKEHTDNRPSIESLVNQLEKFVLDSRKPIDKRKYKLDKQLIMRSGAQAGPWRGGVQQISSNYISSASLDPNAPYDDDTPGDVT